MNLLAIALIVLSGILLCVALLRSSVNPYVGDKVRVMAAIDLIDPLHRRLDDLVQVTRANDRRLTSSDQALQQALANTATELHEKLADMQAALVAYVDKSQQSLLQHLAPLRDELSHTRAWQSRMDEWRGRLDAQLERHQRELQALFTVFGASRERPSS